MQSQYDIAYLNYLFSQPFKTSFKYTKNGEHIFGNIYLIFAEESFAYAALSYLLFCLDTKKILLNLRITSDNKTELRLKEEKSGVIIELTSSSTDILEASFFTDGTVPYDSIVLLSFQYQKKWEREDVTTLADGERIPKQFLTTVLYRYDNDGFQMLL